MPEMVVSVRSALAGSPGLAIGNAIGSMRQVDPLLRELLRHIFDALPAEMIRSRPWLCVAYAWALIYAGQMEALKKYRAKAQQTVRVERVTVEDGGQAIVGNVTHGGGHDTKK